MNNFIKSISLFIALLIGGLCSQTFAQEEPTNGLLYQVSGNGLKKPSYLFGTFHLLNSDYLKETPKVAECFDKAKGVVVELELTPNDLMVMQTSMLMPDKKLSDLLTKEELDKLDSKLTDAMGFGISLFNNLKPAAVATLLAAAMPPDVKARIEKYRGSPMDMYFIEEGRNKKKTITGLETVQEQIDILMGKPIDEQVVDLKKYITKIDEADTITAKIVDLYFAQDLAGLWAISTDNKEFVGDMKRLLDDRNNNWMKKLPGLMKKQPQFIAVGALHLAGPVGLVYQLRKAGYTVTPIK
ncbi:MAG: TraB/GumN family protein [Sphingobacteriales bacterium JAD_PAG50586_3]|nr:MAG: TraB/GumN family protein [Sphingobacteriales bacterium JAD_PAG50586_3]